MLSQREDADMAKGQKRSSREVKKPKKNKSAAPAPSGSPWPTLDKTQADPNRGRKK
jgi:hypothetical protein